MKKDTGYLIAILILLLAAAGGVTWGFMNYRAATVAKEELAEVKSQAEFQQKTLTEAHDELVKKLNQNWTDTLNESEAAFEQHILAAKKEQRAEMAAAYSRFEALAGNGDQALRYIGQLETRLRDGKELSESELADLTILATNLDLLRQQYQKPLLEFEGLAEYLTAQANAPVAEPGKSFLGLRRLISKDYREAQRNYKDQLAARGAYQDINDKFSSAYSRAQTKVTSAAAGLSESIQYLQDVLGAKSTNYADLEDFFSQSRTIIGAHQELLEFTPEPPPTNTEPPR